jgi:hypothetical protein
VRNERTTSTVSSKDRDERRIAGLLSERDVIMNEIALRARLASLPPMLAKARTLLTRFWGRADWNARSEILAVARMLLTLGAAQPALRQPQTRMPAKRRAVRSGVARRRIRAPASPKIVGTT